MDRLIENFIGWKYYGIFTSTVILGSFVAYWCSVSGLRYLFCLKFSLLILPTILYFGKKIARYIIADRKRREHQRSIIIQSRLRRLFDKVA